MKNLKSKFIVFLCALLVFITVPCTSVSAKYISNYNCVYFFVAGRQLCLWTGFFSGGYSYFNSVSDASSLISSLPSDTYVFFAIRDDANGDLTESCDEGIENICIRKNLHYISLLDFQLNVPSSSSWDTNEKVENLLLTYSSEYISSITGDDYDEPDTTYFPVVTPRPQNIYQPSDNPIGSITSSFSSSSFTGSYYENGNLVDHYAESYVNVYLFVNGDPIFSKVITMGANLQPPVTSLGILSLFNATYYTRDGNVYVNYDDKLYQYTGWYFYLTNGNNSNTFGTSSHIPISTQLNGSSFYISPNSITYYFDYLTGEQVVLTRPNYPSSQYAKILVNIDLTEVEGEIYNPPVSPSPSDDPYIDPNYKPLIPPNDPTLNNPSTPPLSDGSSSLSSNTSGEGFDLNHYLNFNYPVVLSYLGFLFTQVFNYFADNNVVFLSVVVVICIGAVFLVIRERL